MDIKELREIRFRKQRVFVNSSNVERMTYDDVKEELTIFFNDGSKYLYEDVKPSVFEKVMDGKAAPKTSGSNRWGSWVKGQAPSVGAAVHKYLINKGNTGKKI